MSAGTWLILSVFGVSSLWISLVQPILTRTLNQLFHIGG